MSCSKSEQPDWGSAENHSRTLFPSVVFLHLKKKKNKINFGRIPNFKGEPDIITIFSNQNVNTGDNYGYSNWTVQIR